jgi:hypothetical protein
VSQLPVLVHECGKSEQGFAGGVSVQSSRLRAHRIKCFSAMERFRLLARQLGTVVVRPVQSETSSPKNWNLTDRLREFLVVMYL